MIRHFTVCKIILPSVPLDHVVSVFPRFLYCSTYHTTSMREAIYKNERKDTLLRATSGCKQRRCEQFKEQEHFRRERTYAYVTEKSTPYNNKRLRLSGQRRYKQFEAARGSVQVVRDRAPTMKCEVYPLFPYSTVPAPSFSSTSASFTDTIFETPFSCIVTPKRVSAWFMVGFLCVITMNCVFSEKFFK